MAIALAWVAILLGAVTAGAAVVALLVAPSRLEIAAVMLAALSSAGIVSGLLTLSRVYSFGREAAASTLAAAALVGGYGLAASLLPLISRPKRLPPLQPPAEELAAPAYVLLSRAEPERYEAQWASSLVTEASDPASSFVPVALLPFLFAAQKARYRMTQGRSPAREGVRALALRLALPLHVPEVHVAFCEPPTLLAETVRKCIDAGHRTVVVAPLSVSEGYPEARAKAVLDALRPEDAGVTVAYAPPLWTSEDVARLMVDRALQFADDDPTTGLAIVMDAQPPSWQSAGPEFDQQEAAFAARVEGLLVDAGLDQQRMRTAWIEWKSPDVTEAVRHLAALGCSRIGVLPASFPTNTLATMLDLDRAAELARTDAAVSVLPPWGNDAHVASVIVSRMKAAAEDACG